MRLNVKEVEGLFKLRDKAVKEKDRIFFLSTQLGEISGSSSHGYLAIDKLKTQILAICPENEKNSELTKTVIVKETYFIKGEQSHQGFLIYHLVKTVKGWKIYNIVY